MIQFIVVAIIALTIAATGIHMAHADAEDIVVERAWARAAIGMKRPGVAYMTIRNIGDTAIYLQSITTPLAKKSEIHRTITNNQGVSSMARAGDILITPGESANLEPGGLHAMLMQLQSAMSEGETFPLTLIFSDGGSVEVDVPILDIAARGPNG